MTDYPDWTAPQANATAISTTGAPLLRLTTALGNANTQIPGGQTVTLFANAPVNQPSYEATLLSWLPAGAGTIPFVNLQFTWVDAATGDFNDTEQFVVACGQGSGDFVSTYLSGPARGDILKVAATNLDPAQTATLSWLVNATSHVYTRDRMLQPAYAATAPFGQTNPAGNPAAGLLAVSSPTLAANATITRLVAAWAGKATLAVDNIGQANAFRVTLQDPATLYSTLSGANFGAWTIAAGGILTPTEVTLPNGPVQITLNNQGSTGSITPTVSLFKQEY